MEKANPQTIYKAIARFGITRAQARKLMPDWWTPDIEALPSGPAELGMHLSRRLSLDLAQLLSGYAAPKGAVANVAYKRDARVSDDKITGASLVASSVAQTVIAALPGKFLGLAGTPAALQALALNISPKLPLGFESLLAMAWTQGVPVIPLPNLPVGMRKMDGAALQVQGRQAIVIAKRKTSRSWLSFILAHEIAHIALGHIRDGVSIIDVSLQDETTYATDTPQDRQEADADVYALELLGGARVEQVIRGWSPRMSPPEMAAEGRIAGKALNVEPGHLILRHAFVTKRWAEANIALRFLSEDFDPNELLVAWLKSQLNLDQVAEDLQDLVTQVTGLNEP